MSEFLQVPQEACPFNDYVVNSALEVAPLNGRELSVMLSII